MPITPEERQAITHDNIGTADCGVAALMAVTGWPRGVAEPRLALHGYDAQAGTTRGGIEACLEEHGVECVLVDPNEWGGDTPATFSMTHEHGIYVLYVDRHVMALVQGDLYNAKASWRMPLNGVTVVLPA